MDVGHARRLAVGRSRCSTFAFASGTSIWVTLGHEGCGPPSACPSEGTFLLGLVHARVDRVAPARAPRSRLDGMARAVTSCRPSTSPLTWRTLIGLSLVVRRQGTPRTSRTIAGTRPKAVRPSPASAPALRPGAGAVCPTPIATWVRAGMLAGARLTLLLIEGRAIGTFAGSLGKGRGP